jgi:hypothetical protein
MQAGANDVAVGLNKDAIENFNPVAAKRICSAFPGLLDKTGCIRDGIKILQIPKIEHTAKEIEASTDQSKNEEEEEQEETEQQEEEQEEEQHQEEQEQEEQQWQHEEEQQVVADGESQKQASSKFWHEGLQDHIHITYSHP